MPQEAKPYTNQINDGRVKIHKDKYEEIRQMYKKEKSMRFVARCYNVDKKIIQFIVFPEKKEQYFKERYKKKVWLKYYDKEKWKLAMRKYRKKKRELGLMVTKTPKK